jgi:hypothetical protein
MNVANASNTILRKQADLRAFSEFADFLERRRPQRRIESRVVDFPDQVRNSFHLGHRVAAFFLRALDEALS